MAAKKEAETATTKKPAVKKTAAKTTAAKKVSAEKVSKKAPSNEAATIRVQYYRSAIGFNVQQKLTIKGLGFGKLNSTRDLIDTPALRGMIAKVPHLVRVIE